MIYRSVGWAFWTFVNFKKILQNPIYMLFSAVFCLYVGVKLKLEASKIVWSSWSWEQNKCKFYWLSWWATWTREQIWNVSRWWKKLLEISRPSMYPWFTRYYLVAFVPYHVKTSIVFCFDLSNILMLYVVENIFIYCIFYWQDLLSVF